MTNDIILTNLKKEELGYSPNDSVQAQLAIKQLIMLVSPAAVGKSTLMNRIVELDNRFARISGFTTRPKRADDEPGMYRYMPNTTKGLAELLQKIRRGDLVQYAVHPTTGYVYGSETKDYPKQYNCADVLGHAIDGFRALPAAGSHTFSIVCSPTEWHERLAARYPDSSNQELQKRIAEAKINLAWSLQDTNTIWVDNSNGKLDTAANTIIQIATAGNAPNETQQANLRATAQNMLDSI